MEPFGTLTSGFSDEEIALVTRQESLCYLSDRLRMIVLCNRASTVAVAGLVWVGLGQKLFVGSVGIEIDFVLQDIQEEL
jgi:hypothetical protein